MNDFSIANPKSPGQPAHLEILDEATHSITDHNIDYGEPAKNYERASALASMILNKPITPYEIAMIKLAVKLSRIAETPDLRKSYVEMIACAALAGEFVNAGHITTKRMAQALKAPPVRMGETFHLPKSRPFEDGVEERIDR
jgi:hypothetical protein